MRGSAILVPVARIDDARRTFLQEYTRQELGTPIELS